MMDDFLADLSARLTAACGIPAQVEWSFRPFMLTCARSDGQPVTIEIEHTFYRILIETTTGNGSLSMTALSQSSTTNPLYDTLIDLAGSADRQAARAVDFNVTDSATLFALGATLRITAEQARDGGPNEDIYRLLDSGRRQICSAMLRYDRLERNRQTQ